MNKIKMFKTFILSGLFLLIVSANAWGQEWEKKMKSHSLINICQVQDSSYWVATHLRTISQSGSVLSTNNLIKLDKNGNKIFNRLFDSLTLDFVKPSIDGGVFVSNYLYSPFRSISDINKLDKEGNKLWSLRTSLINELNELSNQNIQCTSIDSFYCFDKYGKLVWKKQKLSYQRYTFQGESVNGTIYSVFIQNVLTEVEYDYNGNVINQKEIYKLPKLSASPAQGKNKQGDYILINMLNDTTGNDVITYKLLKVNNSKVLMEKIISIGNYKNRINFNQLLIDKNENILIGGDEIINGIVNLGIIQVLDINGNYKSMHRFNELPITRIRNFIESNDNHYIILGTSQPTNSTYYLDGFITKTKATKINKLIVGKIIIDEDLDCIVDSLEIGSKNRTLSIKSNNRQFYYCFTDKNGNYQGLVDTGKYTLKIENISPYFYQACDSVLNINSFSSKLDTLNLFLQKTLDCPYLTTNIANFALRPCFDATQIVNFCNYGSITAQNAYVEVQLDPNLTYQSSSIVATPLGNGKYRFNLGNLPIDSCGQFTILTKVACDNSLLGKTLCNKVHIYPDSLCNQDLGKIKVNGTCNNTTIQFDIKNESDKAMSADKNYIIIEDVVMFKQGTFKLNANETLPIQINAQPGKTYRLIAEQTNPIYGSLATTAFENCNVSASPSTGFINQFAQGDDSPFEDIDCRVVTASYDPNDKQAVPQGVQNQHYIAKNTDIEYMIRFQNKGTDTAFTVIIKDTLSQYLDPATIVPGASSHPYRFDLTDKGIAKFIFANIQLPHQKVNDEGSNGFVKFRIKQQRDLPNGNVIKNKAAIYFDFNDPIITNETFHTIGENWLMIIPIKEVNKEAIEVKIYPNPFSQSTTIELEGEYNDLTFNVFDVNGRLLRSEKFNGNRLNFERNGLDGGMYIYDILTENQSLQKGKIVIF